MEIREGQEGSAGPCEGALDDDLAVDMADDGILAVPGTKRMIYHCWHVTRLLQRDVIFLYNFASSTFFFALFSLPPPYLMARIRWGLGIFGITWQG